MALQAETLRPDYYQTIPTHERHLTELDHLSKNRLEDGIYPDKVLEDVLSNLKTAVQEGGMPHAVSTTVHERETTEARTGVFRWMGKTAVENAMSGYKFHSHESALKRVDVEVDEARHSEKDLKPGMMKIFISPRMSLKDATTEIAKQEHLSDDDAVRVSWLETDDNGDIQQRVLQSLLIKDVPLSAWVAMLQDPNNLFGRTIAIDEPDSALSVMQIHRELEVPMHTLKDGPVDIVRGVLPYISDPQVYDKVANQVSLFESDQDVLDARAEAIAERWLKFEIELTDSLVQGEATLAIESFIVGLQHHWKEIDLKQINNHSMEDKYMMTRELASILEHAKRNTLWVEAAVVSGNQLVIKQMDSQSLQKVYDNAESIFLAQQRGMDIHFFESQNSQLIATQNVNSGGGCPGTSNDIFRNGNNRNPEDMFSEKSKDWKTDPKSWKQGVCRIKACPTRPGSTKVGPCDVCVGCQGKYEAGQDPSKDTISSSAGQTDKLFDDIYKMLQKEDKKKELSPA